MISYGLYLQKCEPGWGYDCTTGLLIPINYVGNLSTYSSRRLLEFKCKQKPFDPNSFINYSNIAHWIINENPNFHKFLDFYFANYQTEFAFKVHCVTRIITAEKSDNSPQEATHFVQHVWYGMRMLIFFDKENSRLFPGDKRDNFLEKVWYGEEKLTKEQENAECSVLIFAKNPEETTVKQMKLSEILQFFEDFENEKYPECETVVFCKVTGITEKISVIDQKFDERMNLFGEKCFKSFEFLRNSKNKHLIEKEQQTDDIDRDANQLNSQTIIMDKNSMFSFKREILQRLKMGLLFLNNVDEPYTWNNSLNKKMLLGFAANQKKFTTKAVETNEMYISVCPEECTNDLRQWICMNCGNFFKTKNSDVVCDCGATHISNLNLECCNSKHKKSSVFCQNANATVPNFTDDQKSILETIKQQLQKLAKQGHATSAEKMNSVIQSIDNLDESLVDQLRTLEITNMDGDTKVLMNNFLDQF